MAYATIEDYEARNGAVDDEARRQIISTRLQDASTMLDCLVEVDVEDEGQLDALRIVACNMVARAMAATDGGLAGIGEVSFGMGPFEQRATLSNPSGDLYVTAGEQRMLGMGVAAIGTIRPKVWGR